MIYYPLSSKGIDYIHRRAVMVRPRSSPEKRDGAENNLENNDSDRGGGGGGGGGVGGGGGWRQISKMSQCLFGAKFFCFLLLFLFVLFF